MAKATAEKPRALVRIERKDSAPEATVIRIDPYHEVIGMLVPAVAQRIVETTRVIAPEASEQAMARGILSRLYQGDPTQVVLAIMDRGSRVVGHAVAQLGTDYGSCWATVVQIRADQNVGQGQKAAIEAIRQWAQLKGATKLAMVTGRGDKGWEEEYGFRLARQVKVADITIGAFNGHTPAPGQP